MITTLLPITTIGHRTSTKPLLLVDQTLVLVRLLSLLKDLLQPPHGPHNNYLQRRHHKQLRLLQWHLLSHKLLLLI